VAREHALFLDVVSEDQLGQMKRLDRHSDADRDGFELALLTLGTPDNPRVAIDALSDMWVMD
jgi:hypothetical protein